MGATAAKARPSNLPAELTSFVGRRQELRDLKQLLTTTRLLTLTGTGGAGKTRIALRVAREVARNFPDGAWFVPLASINDPMLVTQAVFNALGVQDLSAGLSLSALADYLASKRLLLILDNCEHLLDSCAVLAASLLAACPGLQILATSRQALGMPAERRVHVPPMSLPPDDDGVSVKELSDSEAVWLLSERAAGVVPGFEVDASNAPAVRRLCRSLDGIPLALELAAVRLGSLTVDQLNRALAREMSTLGGANRGAEARQQTLDATIGWSYGLLDEPERLLWARLSVFAGGFDQEAAVEVCSDERLPADRIVDLIAALVEKSILTRELHDGGAPRYSLLETLRQYGRLRLSELGEEAERRTRHFEWIRSLARPAGAWDGRQPEVFNRINGERDNLWAALDFCLSQPDLSAAVAEMALDLMVYWECRGPWRDVQRVVTSLAELAPKESLPHARLLWVAAVMASAQNDYVASADISRESLRIGEQLNDAEMVASSSFVLAASQAVAGHVDEAKELAQSALSLARLMQLKPIEQEALNVLSLVALAMGDLDRAIELGEQALAISRQSGELWDRGYVLNFLSQARWIRGDRQRAEAEAKEGAVARLALDDRNGLVFLLETLAWMAAQRGAHERAAMLLGSIEHVCEMSSLQTNPLVQRQHEQSVSVTVTHLGQGGFDAAFKRGRAMTIDEAVAFAVDERAPSKQARVASEGPSTPLTRREMEIARLIAEGMSDPEIANRLFLSPRTVESHVTNMFNKLGLNSRLQLVRWLAANTEPEVGEKSVTHGNRPGSTR